MTQRPRAERVLVIFPGALGDLICAMPAIAAIARRHAGASIELMARAELARLVVGRTGGGHGGPPHCGHSIDAREVGELFGDGPADGARRLFSQFDRVYSFFAFDNARFRARLIAANDGEVSFYPFRPVGEGHVSEAYLRAIGEAGSSSSWRLEPTAEDLAVAERELAHSGCGGSGLIVMFPGSGSAAKNWPVRKFLALAAMLAKGSGILRPYGLQNDMQPQLDSAAPQASAPHKGPPPSPSSDETEERTAHGQTGEGVSVVVVLGPAEVAIESVFREAGVAVIKALDLPTVAALARLAGAFVGNDSGVSHLAAAVGASGVVIFGPSDPVRWRPIASRPGQQIEIVRGEPIERVEPREVAGVLSKICRAAANIID